MYHPPITLQLFIESFLDLSDVSYISEQDSMRANMQALNEIPFDPRSFQGGYSTVHSNTGQSG